jgi:outer membrane protein assembly factor BamB
MAKRPRCTNDYMLDSVARGRKRICRSAASMAVLIALTACSVHAGEIADAVKKARISGGIIVLVNSGDATYDEAAATKCTVHGLETDSKRIDALRKRLLASGRYGKISARAFNGKTLPYIDNLVNLVVIEGGVVSPAEAMRVLAPRGIALIKRGDSWTKAVKAVPDNIDEWNQYLRNADNNGVSTDKVGPPERLRWTGGSRWGRSHMSWVTVTSMLSANGRLFTIEDLESVEYHKLPARFHLIARDAFNGCELWRKGLKGWHETASYVKFVPTQIQRRMVAVGDKIYCTLGYTAPISVFDAATGEKLKTLPGTGKTAELAYDRGVIYAIVGEPYGIPRSRAKSVTLKAFDAKTGARKWGKRLSGYVGGSLAAKDACVAYCTNNQVVCCDSASGRVTWTADSPGLNVKPAKRIKGKRGRPTGPMGGQDNLNPTLVLTDAMLYCSTINSVKAYGRLDGKLAWTGKNVQNYMKTSDIFVADGLVWTGLLNGHNPKTGKIERKLTQVMNQPMGHDRCYRNRITDTYFINSKTGGSDFVSLKGAGEFPSPWIRATCGLSPLPANGLLYSSPYSCSCLKGSMITGFNAVYSGGRVKGKVMKVEPVSRLVKGKAYGSKPTASPAAADWPAYRNGSDRSGLTKAHVSGKLKPIWKIKLPSLPTASTVVGDLVYVAARESHTLYALSRKDGATVWTYTAGGSIDSPPTHHRGLLVFGSRDGWVHAVRAADGMLSWKFCDLPDRRLMSANGRLESVWPINGAVMIRKGLAYFAAGRSSFLDGGIIVYALDPLSGRVVHRRQVSGPYAKNGFPIVGKRNTRIEGFKGGIFSSEGDLLYIRHQAFKPDLAPVPLVNLKRSHLIASGGFLDDTPQHRTYWTIDTDLCYGPNKGALGAGPKGDILVMDGDSYYEIRGYLPARHSTSLVPQKGYTLYSGQRAAGGAGVWKANWKTRTVPRLGAWKKRWSTQIPLTGNALVVAGDTIIAAGVPLQESFDLPQLSETYAGRRGGVLWTASAKDGAKIAELKLSAQPVWDGLSAAHGQCIITLRDGTVMCLGD